jgi:hypothetical protein
MNWQSHLPIEFEGVLYGQKDIEFQKFIDLPKRTTARLEVALSGGAPQAKLTGSGWRLREAHTVTKSYKSFRDYIRNSMGEFSICKSIFVETRTGWFSDRSAAYLASGRPVILQDTGFSAHLPCGLGLYAINSVDEAAVAIESISSNLVKNSKAAREIASDQFSTSRVLPRLLQQLGL